MSWNDLPGPQHEALVKMVTELNAFGYGAPWVQDPDRGDIVVSIVREGFTYARRIILPDGTVI